MNKKLVSIFTAGILLLGGITGCSFDKDLKDTEASERTEEQGMPENSDGMKQGYSNETIVIGDTEWSTGDITPYWTSNSVDSRVYRMVSGYSTTVVNREGKWQYDYTVLKHVQEKEENDGSKTWIFTIRDGLEWSNGEPVTAEDYVFALLLTYSKEWISGLEAEKSLDSMARYYVGASDYKNGLREYFRGVHLIDEMTFSVTVSSSNLPNYYEKQLVCVTPEYRKGWLPEDVTVKETKNGAKLSDNFTVEYIAETVEAFRYNPAVSCGPYIFESYDYNSGTYTLLRNPHYKGNYEGQTANVGRVVYQYVSADTALDQLRQGDIDVLAHCCEPEVVSEGLTLALQEPFGYCMDTRLGYGMISFKCNQGPTQYTAVRQAIAYLLDRGNLAENYLGGCSTPVNGPYSPKMWMVQKHSEEMQELNPYDYNIDFAAEVLEQDGWVYNEDGSDYEGEGIRYKKTGKHTYMPLVIEWCAPEASAATPFLKEAFVDNPALEAVGMQINVTEVSVNELEMYYYDNTADNPYQMFSLAYDFKGVYDFTEKFEADSALNLCALADDGEKIEVGMEDWKNHGSEADNGEGEESSEGAADTEGNSGDAAEEEDADSDMGLYELACAMRETEETADAVYFKRWFSFVKRWNQLLPEIPLYCNNYYDFYSDKVVDYQIEGYNQDISYTILYLNVK